MAKRASSSSTSRWIEHTSLHELKQLDWRKQRENKVMTTTTAKPIAVGSGLPDWLSAATAPATPANTATPPLPPTGSKGRRRPRANGAFCTWPPLSSLGLSPEDKDARIRSIGGSDANTILSGSPERVLRLWREKRGEEAPEDLSGNLAVMLGCWSEAFNRQWYERAFGERVSRVGEQVFCPDNAWRSATLDGYVAKTGSVWEAKHTNAFAKADEVLARYMPQLQHNMAVAMCDRAVLSVIFGNSKWEVFEVAADWLYQQDLLDAEERFRECVHSGTPPTALPPPPAPRPIGVREVCLEGSNEWAAAAADWLANREAARKHQAATVSLKELVEPDVARAFGHGIEARRSKAGALTIKELGA
ncbi:YqaJ viral recombinase family protein [Tsuneonella sp. HG249]